MCDSTQDDGQCRNALAQNGCAMRASTSRFEDKSDPQNRPVVYAMSGDSVTLTTDGVDANGKLTHTEWSGKFDGKDYPVAGSPDVDMRAWPRRAS